MGNPLKYGLVTATSQVAVYLRVLRSDWHRLASGDHYYSRGVLSVGNGTQLPLRAVFPLGATKLYQTALRAPVTSSHSWEHTLNVPIYSGGSVL